MQQSHNIRSLPALLLGIGAALAALSAVDADARGVTAFGAFKVQNPSTSENPYQCLVENNGAVVNECTYDVNLAFDMPIDNGGTHSIEINNYWGAVPHYVGFGCYPYVYTGTQGYAENVGAEMLFTTAPQGLTSSATVSAGDSALSVICYNVPPGEGIGDITWSP